MVAFSATVISATNVFVYHIVQIEITINFISHVMSQVVFIRKKKSTHLKFLFLFLFPENLNKWHSLLLKKYISNF